MKTFSLIPDRPWTLWWTIGFLVLCLLILGLHAASYDPFFADDSLISLRYSQRLLEGKGLTWNDGERVEGYSNLLWVLLCAIPGGFGVNLILGARAIGYLCVLATCGAFLFAVRPVRVRDAVGPFFAAMATVSSPAVAAWAGGGLEGVLGMCLLVWLIALLTRADDEPERRSLVYSAALTSGLMCWNRPDAPLFVAAIALTLLTIKGKAGLRTVLILAGVTATFVILQLTFRVIYYGDYLPNTAYAKLALTDERTELGLKYWRESLRPLAATWLVLVFGVLYLGVRRLRLPLLLCLVSATSWTGYVVHIGGDIFPTWRHFLFAIGLAGFVLALLLNAETSLRSRAAWGCSLVVLAFAAGQDDPRDWAKREEWEWDGVATARLLRLTLGPKDPLIAVDAAGSIPYFSGLRTLDMLGLNDRYLAHHRPKTMGHGFLGHELGDAKYYEERSPDVVCFGPPPCFRESNFVAEREWARSPSFRRDYALAHLETRRKRTLLLGELWVKRRGKAGVERIARTVRIPALLLSPTKSSPCILLKDKLVVRISANERVKSGSVEIEPGTWTVRVAGRSGRGELTITDGMKELAKGATDGELSFSVATKTNVQITLQAGTSETTLEGVDLERH